MKSVLLLILSFVLTPLSLNSQWVFPSNQPKQNDNSSLIISIPTASPTPVFSPTPMQSKPTTIYTPTPYVATHDGTRTGKIVSYYSYCEKKNIQVYENELIPYTTKAGKQIYSTKDDIKCYEDEYNSYSNQNQQGLNTNIPTYNQTTYYPCTLYYPALGYSQTYLSLYKTKAECDAQQSVLNQESSTYVAPNPTTAVITPSMTKSQCQSNVNDEYQPMMTSRGCLYPCPSSGDCGSTSVCDVLWSIAQQAMEACNNYP